MKKARKPMSRGEMKPKRYLADEELHEIRHEENILKGLSIQEAIEYNKNLREYMKITDKTSEYKFLQENYEALDMAIKALEQTELNPSYNSVKTELKPRTNLAETSQDTISREALRQKLQDHHDFIVNSYDGLYKPQKYKARVDEINKCIAVVVNAPSVTPKQKTGKWILKHRKHNSMKWLTGTDEYGIEHTVKKYEEYECDEPYCSECGKLAGDTSQNYCPYCGAKMEKVEK